MKRILFLLLLFGIAQAEPSTIEAGSPVFIAWLPQAEAVSYNVKLHRVESDEEAMWNYPAAKACVAVHEETGAKYCGFNFEISSGTYIFSVSWQLEDGSGTPWYSSTEFGEGDGWQVYIVNPCAPSNFVIACKNEKQILFVGIAQEEEENE